MNQIYINLLYTVITAGVRIRIPIEQQLTPKIISELFGKVKKGDNL